MKPALNDRRFNQVLDTAAELFEVPRREIAGRCRLRSVSRARLAVYAALYDALEASCLEIGHWCNRDHTTVLYGISQAKERAAIDSDYAACVQKIQQAALA